MGVDEFTARRKVASELLFVGERADPIDAVQSCDEDAVVDYGDEQDRIADGGGQTLRSAEAESECVDLVE